MLLEMEDELLDYATVCATGLICLVIALLFGWNFIAALIWGCLTGAVQAGAIRLIHGRADRL